MENIHNVKDDISSVIESIQAEMRELEKDEISSKVIKKFSQLVSLRIMDQIRFKVWHQVCEEVKKEF